MNTRNRQRDVLAIFDTIFRNDGTEFEKAGRTRGKHVRDTTVKLFTPVETGPYGDERAVGVGSFPNDDVAQITEMHLVLINVDDPMRRATVLGDVTIGLEVNGYGYVKQMSMDDSLAKDVVFAPRRRWQMGEPLDNSMDDPERHGAWVSARMGFHVIALIGTRAKKILEETPNAHLVVELHGIRVKHSTLDGGRPGPEPGEPIEPPSSSQVH